MGKQSKVKYDPQLTIKQNADKNKVTVFAIRWYIAHNDVDRSNDTKKNIVNAIQHYLEEHPDATKSEVSKNVENPNQKGKYLSLSTVRKYWDYAVGKKRLRKKSKRTDNEYLSYSKRLDKIPFNIIQKYVSEHIQNDNKDISAIPTSKQITIQNPFPINPFDKFQIPISDCIQIHSKALPENQVLSNHYDCIITFRGIQFYGVEQLYHALIFTNNPDALRDIMAASSGTRSKSICNSKYKDGRDDDYRQKNFQVLTLCHQYKYLCVPEFRNRLKETYPQTLAETPNGKDYLFGLVQNLDTNVLEGSNYSGRSLMYVRDSNMKVEQEYIAQYKQEHGNETITPDYENQLLEDFYKTGLESLDTQFHNLSQKVVDFIKAEHIPLKRPRKPKPISVPVIDFKSKCLIIDFDSTLFDTSVDSKYRKVRGKKDWDKIFSLIPEYKLYDGWDKVFKWIKANNIKVGILSSASRELIEKTCRYHNINIDAIVGYQPYIQKPNPILGNMILGQLNVREKQVVFIGDSLEDEVQARCCQMKFYGAGWDTTEKDKLQKKSTVLGHPTEIIKILKQMN